MARLLWARARNRPLWSHVTFLLTMRCDLRCAYCDFPRHEFEELDTPAVIELLEALHRSGTFRLGLSGGEPLLRDDLGAIVRATRRLGFLTSVVTNGRLLLERWSDLVGAQYVLCTVDGDEQSHDALRGAGSFERVVRGLETLRARTRSRLGLICAVHAGNRAGLERPLELAEALGCAVFYQPVQHRVGWLGARCDDELEAGEIQDAFRQIRAWRRAGRPVVNSGVYLDRMSDTAEAGTAATCMAGRYYVTLLPDGRVTPCCMVPFPDTLPLRDHGSVRRAMACSETPRCAGCTIAPYFENSRLYALRPDAWWNAVAWGRFR